MWFYFEVKLGLFWEADKIVCQNICAESMDPALLVGKINKSLEIKVIFVDHLDMK